jgi:2-polyprenyl-3-methyl-5-hydroxy-6-metoxy-1,4-benzoquinol methylase
MTVSKLSDATEYHYANSEPAHTHTYLMKKFIPVLEKYCVPGSRLFEIGAGNGYVAHELIDLGYDVTAIEPSLEGVALAKTRNPELKILQTSVYDEFDEFKEGFDFVYSLEVIEHLYAPRELVKKALCVLKPGGYFSLSTPFHGYWKNLALALSGKLDAHFTALWDHGHIKFWSLKTLMALLRECGFEPCQIDYAGRFYPFSNSILVTTRKRLPK